jgi:hypothetical protein
VTSPAPIRDALRPTWAFVAVVVVLALAVRTPGYLHELFDPDEAAIASQAISLREGGTLYVDAIDRKPPLPPFLFELSFRLTGSTDLRPLHLVAALGLAGSALVLGLDARRRHGARAGWWAALVTVGGAVAFFPVDAQSANYAHLALFPGAVAVVWARRGTVPASAVAGVALGVAVLSRQSWIAGVVPGLAAAWLAGGRTVAEPVAARLARGLAFVVAMVATVAAAGLAVPFDEFWAWTFSETGGYVLSEVDVGPTLGRFAATVAIFVGFHLTLVAAGFLAGRDRIRDWSAWRTDLDLWLWVAAGCAAVLAGFRFFGHYWLQVLPPAVVLVAPRLADLRGRMARFALAGVAVPAALAVAFAFTPDTFRTLPDPEPLAAFVDTHTDPGDTVFVWGNFPEVHWRGDRPPGGALVHSDFITGRSGGREPGPETLDEATDGASAALFRSFRRHPPRLVLDTSTAAIRDYDAYPLTRFTAIHRWVQEHYELTTTIDGVEVWTRLGDEPTEPSP